MLKLEFFVCFFCVINCSVFSKKILFLVKNLEYFFRLICDEILYGVR